jgi:hypothetical protein
MLAPEMFLSLGRPSFRYPNLRQRAKQRLETHQVEDWEGRLFGPATVMM